MSSSTCTSPIVTVKEKDIRIVTIGDKESYKKMLLCKYGDTYCENTPYDFPPQIFVNYDSKNYSVKLRYYKNN